MKHLAASLMLCVIVACYAFGDLGSWDGAAVFFLAVCGLFALYEEKT